MNSLYSSILHFEQSSVWKEIGLTNGRFAKSRKDWVGVKGPKSSLYKQMFTWMAQRAEIENATENENTTGIRRTFEWSAKNKTRNAKKDRAFLKSRKRWRTHRYSYFSLSVHGVRDTAEIGEILRIF